MASLPDRRPAELAYASKARTGKVIDSMDADLLAAWVRAWDAIQADLLRLLERAAGPGIDRARRLDRANLALRLAADELERLAAATGIGLTQDAQALIRESVEQATAIMRAQNINLALNDVRRADFDAMVRRTLDQITSDLRPLSQDAQVAMRRALIRGTALGHHTEEAARRMLADVQQAFNGGLVRARVIARTELADAYRSGANATYQANADVLTGWVWLATLSPRTCPACWGMHGSVHAVDEWGPNDHHAGRCTAMPITKGWTDLGVGDVADVIPGIPDAETEFNKLSRDEQRRVLGPGRLAAHEQGRFPIGDWPTRRDNPGWRESIATAAIPGADDLAA